MQISGASDLTWLQSVGLSGQTGQAGTADGQSLFDDASGAEGASSSPLASLQSPGQLFSTDSLNTLIAAQTSPSSDGSPTSGAMASSSAASGSATSANGIQMHHHHRAVGLAADAAPTAPQGEASSPVDSASASAASEAQTTMSELLTTL